MTTISDISGIDFGKPVQVYRNLHKPGCQYSVRQGGKVIGYVDAILLVDCRFKHASPKQLAEVRTGARQVCQWVTGTIATCATWGDMPDESLTRIACDPKQADGFCTPDNVRIDFSSHVSVNAGGLFAAI